MVRSDGREHYAPGDVIVQHGQVRAVAIPSLAVFADRAFIEAHCFRTGGFEEVEGKRLFRIDFQAAEKIDSPDLNGSMYLDPANFVIRRSVIRVSKLSRGLNEFDSITVTSQFEEIFPGIPIVAEADGLSHYAKPRVSNRERLLAFAEHQRDVQVRFLRAVPRRNEDAGEQSSAVQRVRRLDRVLGVFDGENGEPIVGAAVTDSASGLTATTTATGTVSLAFLSSSRAVLQIRAQGYPDVRTELRLTFSDTIPVTMILHRVSRPSTALLVPVFPDAVASLSSLRRTRVRIVYTATSSAF
jgi:hypothetical protein